MTNPIRINCPCGSTILKKSIKTHELTKRHRYYLQHKCKMIKTNNPHYQRTRLNNDATKRMKQRQACRDYYERNKDKIFTRRRQRKEEINLNITPLSFSY